MKQIEWGFLIVNYLFLGGLSAGLYFVAGLATLLPETPHHRYTNIGRTGALLAPWPVAIGSLLLIFDLGNWYRFYKLFTHFRWASPMSIGSWLLLAFSSVSMLFMASWFTEKQTAWIFSKLPVRLRYVDVLVRKAHCWKRGLALLGLPLSVGVGIYTGVLLGAVQSRPFWNTNLVAQLFLLSALSSGCAALIVALALTKCSATEMRLLYGLDVVFLTLEFFIVAPYLIHGQLSVQAVQDALKLVLGGPFTLLFWLFFLTLGVVVPLCVEMLEVIPPILRNNPFHFNKTGAFVTAALVLVGGFLLRYIFVFAGQMSRFE